MAWLLRWLHVSAACVLAGGIALLDLRVLGVARALPLRPLWRMVVPASLLAFAVMVPTGLLMFVTRASELLGSGVLLAKMTLLFALGGVAVAFHLGPSRKAERWASERGAPAAARVLALASLLGWMSVLGLGVALRPA